MLRGDLVEETRRNMKDMKVGIPMWNTIFLRNAQHLFIYYSSFQVREGKLTIESRSWRLFYGELTISYFFTSYNKELHIEFPRANQLMLTIDNFYIFVLRLTNLAIIMCQENYITAIDNS